MVNYFTQLLLSIALLYCSVEDTQLYTLPSKENIINHLQDAFNTQVSLSEDYRTHEEITELLSPYFNDEFMNKFISEKVVQEEDGYITLGTDIARYYIPFFSYTDQTVVIYDIQLQQIYIYEYFLEENNILFTSPDHYEIVTLSKVEGEWKIAEIESSESKPYRISEIERTNKVE
ncbi:DUF3993 domain-containing protein [Bacillus sp. SCS-151]|uniref:DUF3993 domain-containing protein n=1 Tax=Nanhaiella sioensis TaxID=3115293 RepID=UPI00397D5F14